MLTINNTLDGYLKDVEILGNTIQDEEDLADIRSVGDKVEGQELYEIPVLSVGKNLFDGNKFTPREAINQYSYIDGILTMSCDGQAYRRVDYILPNTLVHGKRYILTANVKALEYSSGYTPGQNFGYGYYNGGSADYYGSFDASSNTTKLEFVYNEQGENVIGFHNEVKEGLIKLQWSNIQIEEGTVATEYEPYQEDKLTILSPVQLEKVGDVADRIVEKNGVWGVEKNIETKLLNGMESNWIEQSQNTWRRFIIQNLEYMDSVYDFTNPNKTLCNRFTYDVNDTKLDSTYLKVYNGVAFYKNDINNLNEFKSWLGSNNTLLKYIRTTPQFVPLPHDQQVKLRTFANKTNISFLTEIEGTIKAQVPKSLGATVNTHTEQINNLNKELDRVKKLEESTVSTVETGSDFTTVEATSNGYFEDVKLEGKTLVNLWADSYKFTIQAGHGNHNLKVRCIKSNTQYTIMLLCDKNASGSINLKDVNNDYANLTAIGDVQNLNIPITFTTLSEGDFTNVVFRIYSKNDIVVNGVMLLEGDHTQNPPSGYIEGLKSVGQDVDEIVVSSVNENLFDINEYRKKENWTGSTSYKAFKIQLKPNTKYTFNRYDYCGNGLNIYVNISDTANSSDAQKNIWVCHSTVSTYINKSKEFITNKTGVVYINTYLATNSNDSDLFEKVFKEFSIYEGTTPKPYTPHQADKKRLLFYNTETQTWEKPVLREWDSIEKHSDGKYYYHQRSGEVVLNGSENWVDVTSTDELSGTDLYFTFKNTKLNSVNGIFDKFLFVNSNSNFKSYVGECCFINNYGTTFKILKSKLSTQDVEGFKQWLQTNNITVVYQLAQEKVYECTNIDLITYANETNYIVECGAILPKSALKVHNNISNVVSLLQKKVSLLESNITKYMITQNRMQLASTYSADSVTFKVDYALCSEEVESYNEDLYNLILHNILVGKDNYDYDKMFTMILDYASWNQISWEQFDILVGLMDIQHNPPVEEIPTDEIVEEIPNEIM